MEEVLREVGEVDVEEEDKEVVVVVVVVCGGL